MPPYIAEGDAQFFARIPPGLHDEIAALARRHLRSTNNEIIRAMQHFLKQPHPIQYDWQFPTWPVRGRAKALSLRGDADTVKRFEHVATRFYGSTNLGIGHAVELWLAANTDTDIERHSA